MQIEHPEHTFAPPPAAEQVAEIDAHAAAVKVAQSAAAQAEQTFRMACDALRVLVPHVVDSTGTVLTTKQAQIDAMKNQVWNCALAAYRALVAAEAA
jgi:hypothetical protein